MIKKNGLSTLIPLSATALSALTFSCQKQEDNNVSILIPFNESDKNDIFNGFQEVVKKFNNQLDKKYEKNKLVLRTTFNKRDINHKLNLELQIKDNNTPSIIVAYPSIVSLINFYNRLIDLTEIANKSSISQNILDFNNRLGIENNKKIYSLPMGLSSEVLIINKQILATFLYSLYCFTIKNNIKNNFILNIDKSTYIKSIIEQYYSLKNITSPLLDFNLEQVKKWNIVIDENIFNYQSNLEKFSSLINITLKKRKFDLIFIKHVENYIYETIFKANNSEYIGYFLKYINNRKIDYKSIFQKNTRENKIFVNAISAFYEKIKDKTFNLENYDITTPIEQINKQLFTIITSRIYKFKEDFFQKKNKDLIFKSVPFKYNEHETKGSYFLQGQFLSAISSSIKSKNEVVKKFISWLYDEKNIHYWKLDNKKIKTTPIEFLSLKMGYVFPTKQFKKIYEKYENNNNKANNLALNNIINNELVPFLDLVDSSSSNFRNYLRLSIINSLIPSSKENLETKLAIEKFLKYLLNLIK